MRRPLAAALAPAAVLLLAACGSSGPPRLSEAAYHERAGAICTSYKSRIRALGQPDQLTQIAPYLAKALPVLADTVDRLGALRAPSAQSDAYGRYVDAMRAARKRAFDLRDAAARGDGNAVQSLLDGAARAGSKTDGLARAAGLAACVQGSG